MIADLRVALGQLALSNPVLAAAGTFGYGVEFRQAVPVDRLGALVTKTITRQPRQGNLPPRIVETPSGMLNSVGLQNVGIDAFIHTKLPELAAIRTPVIVSVMGESREELAELCRRLEPQAGVAAIELNLSCPNVHRTGVMVSQDPESTHEFVAAARAATRKPLIAKLSPDVTDPCPAAQAAERAGADALALCNTYTGMSLDPQTRRSRLGALTGGLSGPAIRPLSLYRLWRVRQVVRCPLIGVGGIARADDAVEFFLAGATAVEVGTATFADPRASVKVLDGVSRYLSRHRLASMTQLIGALQHEPIAG